MIAVTIFARSRIASRSATLQAVLRAIDMAADGEPSPDIIVLPAFAGAPDFLERGGSGEWNAIGPTVAALSHRARTWGVFIAFGMSARRGDEEGFVTLLLDPDGDLLPARPKGNLDASRATVPPDDAAGATAPGVRTADTLLGRIALMSGEDVFSDSLWKEAAASGATTIMASGRVSARALKAARVDATHGPEKIIATRARHHALSIVVSLALSEEYDGAETPVALLRGNEAARHERVTVGWMDFIRGEVETRSVFRDECDPGRG